MIYYIGKSNKLSYVPNKSIGVGFKAWVVAQWLLLTVDSALAWSEIRTY